MFFSKRIVDWIDGLSSYGFHTTFQCWEPLLFPCSLVVKVNRPPSGRLCMSVRPRKHPPRSGLHPRWSGALSEGTASIAGTPGPENLGVGNGRSGKTWVGGVCFFLGWGRRACREKIQLYGYMREMAFGP